ncbi:MAG: glycoside hydrolase family 88 protein [Opitutaceae bacterium]|jgi:rhamnogalacturonyl hydrolase YesR
MDLSSRLVRCRFSISALACVLSLPALAQLPSRQAVLSTVSNVNNYWIQSNSAGSVNNNWDGAVYMIGDMAAYDATGNASYLSYAESWASSYKYALLTGDSTRDANYQAAGEVYVRLYQLTGTASDLTHITTDVKNIVNSSSSADWTWVDALNMAMPVFAELGQINNDSTFAAKMYSEFEYTKTAVGGSGLYNPSIQLWWRDSSYVGGNVYWSRGNAWAFVALAKVLATLPTSDAHYTEYLGVFRAMAAKLITLQQSDGFWHSNLTNPSQYPTPETSGTAGFTYGLAWGINAGALDSATYLPVVAKAWNGMVATAVHSNGLLGYVQGVGYAPGSSSANSTADFGVGLFLEAGSEVAKLAGSSSVAVSAPTFNPGGGVFSSSQMVKISTATSGASIRYTTDGSTPSETAGTIYSGPVSIASTTTLKAMAYESGMTDSAVVSATYTLSVGPPPTQVSAPVFSPPGGTFSSALSVTISTATSGASIRYTTDGSAPSETAGTIYSGPVGLSGAATTLKAMAYASGLTDSSVTSALYTIGSAGNRSLTGSSGDGFHALALMSAQTGIFTATFDATPSVSPENSVVGLSQGKATAYTGIACVARFNPTGQIDAYNGTGYGPSTISYSVGVSYHFRLVVNVPANTYSIYVTPAGGSELTVGTNYGFRAAATSLDTWDLDVNSSPARCSLSAINLTP